MFRKEGLHINIIVSELHLRFTIHLFNEETYEDWELWATDPNELISNVREFWRHNIRPDYEMFDPAKARQERSEFFKRQAEELPLPQVPVDYRFVD